MTAFIRTAQMIDRQGIHDAHMRSIREICVKDHGLEEIKGWGYRPLGDRWIAAIEAGFTWVVEFKNQIHGVAYIKMSEPEKEAHIYSLYLTPDVVGRGMGRELMTLMLGKAREFKIKIVSLESTISAHEFYKKWGFKDVGPIIHRPIGGFPVTSFPMQLHI